MTALQQGDRVITQPTPFTRLAKEYFNREGVVLSVGPTRANVMLDDYSYLITIALSDLRKVRYE